MDAERGLWDLAVRQPLRWGIAGCGKIAEDFAAALTTVPGAQLTAAASSSAGLSSLERAQVPVLAASPVLLAN